MLELSLSIYVGFDKTFLQKDLTDGMFFLVEFVIEFHLNGWFDRSAASG